MKTADTLINKSKESHISHMHQNTGIHIYLTYIYLIYKNSVHCYLDIKGNLVTKIEAH